MKEITLTQNQVALVDDEDFERINQYHWYVNFCRGNFYAARKINTGIDLLTGKQIRRHISMASVILNTTEMVDHKDRNTLNNQKYNLRSCTHITNGRNRGKSIYCSSKYKGVSLDKEYNKWRALIYLRDIYNTSFRKHLGFFEDEKEAARVYDKAAKKEFGEFACLNFKE